MDMKKVFVVGAGAMGSGIAQVCASSGFCVNLFDAKEGQAESALKKIQSQLTKQASRGKITDEQLVDIIQRLFVCDSLEAACDCDIVIEAAAERMDVKKSIFEQLNRICKKECILATNTSSLSVTEIASVVDDPSRVVGLHFFNPVPAMKLLEVVKGLCTSAETLEEVKIFGEKIKKVLIYAKDSPAFLVSRMLTMQINEAVVLLEEGKGSVEDIDNGMVYGCGNPMGPLTLLDMVGIDITLAVAETLYRELGDPKYRPALLLRNMVRAGLLGQKTGKGFYIYDENGKKTPNPIFN